MSDLGTKSDTRVRRRHLRNIGADETGTAGLLGARAPLPGNPLVVPREEHTISRKHIDPDALKVMYRLIHHGHRAFLVGGGVRDLLLEKHPKDFDIGTDATPERVRQLFRNSRIIGRRFRINHVCFVGGKVIEVSTFRAHGNEGRDGEVKTLREDNTYGDPESDALRRDLTINGLFYDVSTFSIVDYVGGLADLRNRIIRFIGVPEVRVQEDPVRMIRAIRHAARTDFTIEPATYEAIIRHRELIRWCPRARVKEEVLRELRGGSARRSLALLEETGLLPFLFPFLATALRTWHAVVSRNLNESLGRIDALTAAGGEIPATVLYLSLAIGNVLDGVVEELGYSPDDPVFQYFWNRPPPPTDPSLPRRKRRTRKRGGRVEASDGLSRAESDFSVESERESLEKVIAVLFRPIGATRKELEAMEMLLRLRRNMLSVDPKGSKVRCIVEHHAFQDTLLLLHLTAADEETRALCSVWDEFARSQEGVSSQRRVHGEPRGRRGQEPRRRGGRRARARRAPRNR